MRKLTIALLAVCLLLGFLSTIAYAQGEWVESPLYVDPVWGVSRPDIYEDKVVWINARYDADSGTMLYQICVKDLTTGEFSVVCDAPGPKFRPCIYGDIVVWEDLRSGGAGPAYSWEDIDIYGYDLSSGQESAVCDLPHCQEHPRIYGDKVVWSDWRNASTTGGDIYIKDLVTGEESIVCDHPASQFDPDIYGDKVVWSDLRDQDTTGSDIYMKNLTTGEVTVVCDASGSQTDPRIHGDIVVWEDGRDLATRDDIYMKNLSTGIEEPVCTAPDDQWELDVYGDRIVWHDDRNSDTTDCDIYGYDVVTGEEFIVCNAPGSQWEPAIYGDIVVWPDRRSGGTRDLYMATYVGEEVIPATVDFDPDTLNLKSKGKYVTAYIELPESYDVANIDISTVKISTVSMEDGIPAELSPTQVGDYDNDGVADLMVKFDRASVQAAVATTGGAVELTVSGELTDGSTFEGTDTIRVIDQGKDHLDEFDPSLVAY